jgi:tetraacyldisaccharide 4'-kinase
VNGLLALAGVLLRRVNWARRALYRAGVLRSRSLPKPVISIGNIAAGGAGKTPAVIALARYLGGKGMKVAVLTRGYGRRDTSVSGVVDALDATKFGDEPVLIKKSAPNVDVIVGPNRFDNANQYLKSHSCDVFILDDGFQHMQVHRDVDVVIDVGDARLYRESRSALHDADLVIPRKLRLQMPDSLRGKRVLAFAALADNRQFFRALEAAGLELAATVEFPDHHAYSSADLARIDSRAADVRAAALVTTEKDAVKIEHHDIIPIPAEFMFDPAVLEKIHSAVSR